MKAIGFLLVSAIFGAPAYAQQRLPVIDMHVHAFAMDDVPPGIPACPGDQNVRVPTIDPNAKLDFASFITCDKPIFGAKDAADHRDRTLSELRRHNVRRAVTDGPVELVADWRKAAGGDTIILPGVNFGSSKPKPIDELRRLYAAGQLTVFGETGIQYRGHRPDDPRYEPYFALAEELDIPVGLHMGEGPPAAARFPGYESFRVDMGQPLLLENLLRKHPKLRIYVMHYGSPFVDQMIAMMFTYPNLYVDVSCNNWAFPRVQFYDALKRMVDAGLHKRILFGSDQMNWPDAIGEAIRSIETAPFLSEVQKRDILYNNAARFLRLSNAEIAEDHH